MARFIIGIAALCCATPAMSQDEPVRNAFRGPSVGAEAGYLEHHFALQFETFSPDGTVSYRSDRYYRSHGIGAGGFAGYDIAISKRGRLGLEVAGTLGGATNSFGDGMLSLSPRFGAKLSVRAGYVLTPRLMAYGLTGYGGNAYRVTDTIGIEGSRDLRWGSSFIVGAGAEYRIDRRIGVRIDGKHVDNQTWQVFIGVPIRF